MATGGGRGTRSPYGRAGRLVLVGAHHYSFSGMYLLAVGGWPRYITLGRKGFTDEQINEAAKASHAHSFIKRLPNGYDTVISENGGNLSTGQKQRLAIVRAILRKPEFLIMDEATSNLDTMTERSIEAALEKICEGMSCLIISHRLKTIKSCDYIYVMDKRNIIEEGSHETLINQNGLYKKLYSY